MLFGSGNESSVIKVVRVLLAFAGVLLTLGLARAQPAPTKPSDAPLPSCFDQTIAGQLGEQLKPRGVQKKNFLKRHKINLVAHGGLYGGDLKSSNWIAGGWNAVASGVNSAVPVNSGSVSSIRRATRGLISSIGCACITARTFR